MSTNPFRQTRTQQDPPGDSTFSPPDSRGAVSDGSGSRAGELSLDTKLPSSFDRHVSFASPPVDTTYPAASYPSSPESVRSPTSQFGQPATPNYRTAFLSDPFEDLSRDVRQDNTIQEALSNAQSNVSLGPTTPTRSKDTAVQDISNRLPAVPQPTLANSESAASQTPHATRQSLDVDAFKRLLLTGDSGRSTPGTATPPIAKHSSRVLNDSSSGTDTASLSQLSFHDAANRDDDDTPRTSLERDRDADNKTKVPPPRPAPRRAQSVKAKPPQQAPLTEVIAAENSTDAPTTGQEKPTRKPPTPPIARRRSHRSPSFKSEETVTLPAEASYPRDSLRVNQKAPPPPPLRKQHSTSQRRPSNDLAPTIEEPETEPGLSSDSRRSSSERPMPPLSRNSSQSVKRQSLGLMNPPPVPPPRRGHGSNRSSVDSFRPSLSSIIGEEGGQENITAKENSWRSSSRDQTTFDESNADSILAELASLQKEVDAARRGA